MYSRVQTSGIGAQWPPPSVAPQCDPAGKSQNVPEGQAAAPRVPQSAPSPAGLGASSPSPFAVDAGGSLVVSVDGLSDPEEAGAVARPEQAARTKSESARDVERMRAFSHASRAWASSLSCASLNATARSRAA